MTAIKLYLTEAFQELGNVTWPTRKQAIRITTIVFVFMITTAILMGAVDQLLTMAYETLLNLKK